MVTGFVAQQISRSSRNLLLLNLFLLGAVAVTTLAMSPYIVECLRGPMPTTVADIAKATSSKDLPRRFLSLDIKPRSLDSYTYHITGGNDNKNDHYHFVRLDRDHFLIVKTSSEDDPTHVEGTLEPLDSDVTNDVLPGIGGAVWGSPVPVMFDAGGYRWGFFVLLAVGIPIAVLAVWNIWKALARMGDHTRHPLWKNLARIGPADEMALALDAEMQAGAHAVGKVRSTQSWLVRSSLLGADAVYLGDVAWAYQHTTKHRTNGIPTGTTFAMVLHDVRGKRSEFRLNQKQVQTLLADLANRVPWATVGYSADLNKGWTKDRAAFLNAVAQRKARALAPQSPAPPLTAVNPPPLTPSG